MSERSVPHWMNPPPPLPPPCRRVPAGFRLEVSSKLCEDVPIGDGGNTLRAYAMLWKSEYYPTQDEVKNVQGEIKSFLQWLGMWQFISYFTHWTIEHHELPPYREPPVQQESGSMPSMPPMQESGHMLPHDVHSEREFLEEFGPLFEQRDEIMPSCQERDGNMPL